MIRFLFTNILQLISFIMITLLAGCSQTQSGMKVINGVETSDYPAVVQLTIGSGPGGCSAGVIAHNTLLTAAHCLEDVRSATELSVKLSESNKVIAKKYSYNKQFSTKTMDTTGGYDIAVVVFDDNTFDGIEPLTVEDKMPAAGTQVRLVGYGCKTYKTGTGSYYGSGSNYGYDYGSYTIQDLLSSLGGYGGSTGFGGYGRSGTIECEYSESSFVKRTGTTKVVNRSYCAANMLELKQLKAKVDADISNPTGEDADTAPGDSGSPVLLESDHTKIVGITSYGPTSYEDNKPACYSSPIYTPNESFLKEAMSSIGAIIPWLK